MADPEPRYIEERIYLPAGMDRDDPEASLFAVRVRWCGGHQWSVAHGRRLLSRSGNWLLEPRPQHLHLCRFEFETACRLAAEHVDAVRVGGRTWAWLRRPVFSDVGADRGPLP